MNIIFGPVPSRRYGRSLGIDIVPMKTCSFNCTFCQLGPTPITTQERKDWIPTAEIFTRLRAWLAQGHPADILTLCGSGEPTLHLHFGDVLRFIREETPYPSLLMSNGSLFTDPAVRRDATLASHVKVSLHSWDQASFEAIARPCANLDFQAIIESYRTFRQAYTGQLDIEVFLIPGINDAPAQTERILAILNTIHPDTITLNTAERPPAESSVKPLPPQRLAELRTLFSQAAAERKITQAATAPYSEAALRELLTRHPLSVTQFAQHFGQTETVIRTALGRIAQTEPAARRIPGFEENA